jgi:hypothetical protein
VRIPTRLLLGAALAGLVAAPAGRAAEPREGEVSTTSPTVVWSGQASGSPVVWANLALGASNLPILCERPFCDLFTLRVAHTADLEIESNSCLDPMTQVEVERPDGSRVFADGLEGSPRTLVHIPAAATGTYRVRTLVNAPPGAEAGYRGRARLKVAPARAVLRARGRAVSRTRAASGKKVRISLTTTSPLTAIRGILRAKGSVVGSGARNALAERGTLVVTLSRRLRPGAYRLGVVADDGRGSVFATATVRVSRRARASAWRGGSRPARDRRATPSATAAPASC